MTGRAYHGIVYLLVVGPAGLMLFAVDVLIFGATTTDMPITVC